MERPDPSGGRDEPGFESDAVRRRKAAMLPALLTAVRWRRRRRLAARGAAAVAAALVVGFGLDAAWGRGHDVAREPRRSAVAVVSPTVHCEVVRDLPGVVARYASAPAAPAEWWIDDAELQRLLDEDARPSGLVRVAGRVAVTAMAVDPLMPPESLTPLE